MIAKSAAKKFFEAAGSGHDEPVTPDERAPFTRGRFVLPAKACLRGLSAKACRPRLVPVRSPSARRPGHPRAFAFAGVRLRMDCPVEPVVTRQRTHRQICCSSPAHSAGEGDHAKHGGGGGRHAARAPSTTPSGWSPFPAWRGRIKSARRAADSSLSSLPSHARQWRQQESLSPRISF